MNGESLLVAIEGGDVDGALRALREHPEDAHARNGEGISGLMLALYRGQTEVAEAIRAARNEIDVFEATALGDAEVVRMLISEDATRVSEWSPDGFTPLHYAAFFGHPEVATVLIEAGADIEALSRNQKLALDARPLHSAAAARALKVCSVLLDAGADPNARQHGEFTPLLEAAQNGDEALACLLLGHGADVNARLADGRSAAQLAREAGHQSLAQQLQQAYNDRREHCQSQAIPRA